MALTGINPAGRTAGDWREIFFAQGESGGVSASRDVLIYGNKTSAGSETVDTISTPILHDADAVARFGARSEWYLLYRKYVEVDPSAKIYGCAVTESGGTAATKTVTFANGAASDTTTCTIEFIGESTSFTVTKGDTAITQAANFATAFNAANSSRWPATAAAGNSPNDHIVTITTSEKGPRSDYFLTGLRCTYAKSVTTTATVSAVSSGTTADDFTTAYAAAALGEYYYQVNPSYTGSAPTSTDNYVGEGLLTVITNGALPLSGKGQQMFFGLICAQATATTIATDSDANHVRAKFYRSKNSDWTPGMLAAYNAAVQRLEETKHPAASLTGYRNDSARSRKFSIPAPFARSDWPTATEIEADLANGVVPICFDTAGNAYLNRSITSYSERSSGVKDYRASEGHIPSVMDFTWALIKQRWLETKQPFVANDPVQGQKPSPGVSYPSSLRTLVWKVIDDLTGPNPLGQYTGPILAPDKIQQMKDSVVVTKVAGGLTCSANFFAVEHLNKSEWTLNETSPAY